MTEKAVETVQELFAQIIDLSRETPGQNRAVYSANWVAAQGLVIKFALAHGLQVMVDDLGTVYADLPGQTSSQVVATGSYIDTVTDGGRYDGLYGVLGGLQAVLNLQKDAARIQHTVRLISFSEEEGSRFPTTFTGSKHYIKADQDLDLTDENGVSFAMAKQEAVAKLQAITGVNRGLPAVPACFTELHIEQGPRLELAHAQIGLVTAICGQRRFTIQVHGNANHAGTTPMDQRQDALLAAAELIGQLHSLAGEVSDQLTFTVGQLNVLPNTVNVIPGQVNFTVDCRHDDDATLDHYEQLLRQQVEQLGQRAGFHTEIERWAHDLPTHLDSQLLAANRKLAQKLGLSQLELASGAGHDSEIMSRVTPTTMIFVPSIGGVSHAPAENTSEADLQAGVALLTASLQNLAF